MPCGMIASIGANRTKMKPFSLLIVVLLAPAVVTAQQHVDCSIDKNALLSLDEQHFDQDIANGGGGWRALAHKQGCDAVAADIIREYRATHRSESSLLYWHEGQLRAMSGDYKAAIPCWRSLGNPQTKIQPVGIHM